MLRRLRGLAIGEAVNVVLQPVIFLHELGMPPTLSNLVGFGLVLLLLIQGSAYWLAKSRQVEQRRSQLPGAGTFRLLRWVNLVALIAGLAVMIPATARAPNLDGWPGLAFWLFAVLEYLNYFHVQLVPTPSRGERLPRVSSLARDLRRIRPPTATT